MESGKCGWEKKAVIRVGNNVDLLYAFEVGLRTSRSSPLFPNISGMRCVVALPAVAGPGRRSHPNPRPRRRGTLVSLLGRCRCGRRHLLGASSAAGLLHLANSPCLAAPPIDPDVSSFTEGISRVAIWHLRCKLDGFLSIICLLGVAFCR
jgi:hypothetical protein